MERKSAKGLETGVKANSGEVALASLLEDLGGGDGLQLAVTRLWDENGARGYLRTVPIPPGGPDALLQFVRAKWGPGWYQLRPYGRRPDGKMGYLPGSVNVELAPLEDVLPPSSAAAGPGAPPIVMQSGMSPDVLRLVLEAARGGGGGNVEILKALLTRKDSSEVFASLLGQVLARPSGGVDLDGALKLIRQVKAMTADEPPQQPQNMENMMMMAILHRIMSPDPPPQPPRPPGQRAQPRPNPAGHPHPHPHAQRQPPPPPPQPQAAAPPPSTPSPSAEVEAEDDVEDEVEDEDELSLEDEVEEHISELADEDPDSAVAWLVENVLNKLPLSVRRRMQELMQDQSRVVVPMRARGE